MGRSSRPAGLCRIQRTLAALGGVLLLAGCGCEQAARETPAGDLALPDPGAFSVAPSEHGYTVLAHDAPLFSVLAELQRLAGFELSAPPEADARRTLSVRSVDRPLASTLDALLKGVPYSLEYDTGHQLVRLALGGSGGEEEPVRVAAPPERAEPPRPLSEAVAPEPAPVDHEAEQDEALAQLSDPDPRVRAQAAEWLYADARGVGVLSDVIVNDPSGSVRIAAAEALGGAEEDEAGAVDALIRALDDPEPKVVIAALDALEFVGDASVVPELLPLLSHPNPEIRERVVEAIEWLDD